MPRSGMLGRSGAVANSLTLDNEPIVMKKETNVEEAVQIVESLTMRQYFPETWLWSISVAE